MTDKQRSERIRRLVAAGADVTRKPRRPIDTELHVLLAPAARRRRAQKNRGIPAEAVHRATVGAAKHRADGPVQYAAHYV